MNRLFERGAEPLLRGLGSWVFPTALFRVPTSEPTLYLTFDDGPAPGVTDAVLSLLERYGAKASFFWIGKNVEAHPEYLNRAVEAGHCVGGHCMQHENGWRTPTKAYVQSALDSVERTHSALFRPPYGRIRPAQARALAEKGVSLVFWSRLSYDFDVRLSAEECIRQTTRGLKPGELIVFHDSLKAEARMLPALEAVLEKVRLEGWRTEVLEGRIVAE